jgi:hypothetical protein
MKRIFIIGALVLFAFAAHFLYEMSKFAEGIRKDAIENKNASIQDSIIMINLIY